MPNEIYHRSDWGESKAEDFGDVYYDHAATNKLYNHSDYYENSDGTDATLKDLNNKASIVLTPTAYSDGSLNTVIPPYAPSYIENVPFVTSEWLTLAEGWSIDETNNKLVAEATWTGINKRAQYMIPEMQVGKTVKFSFDAVVTAGKFHFLYPFSSGDVGYGSPNFINQSGSYSFTSVATGSSIYFRNKSTDFTGEITNIRVEVIEEADFDFSRGSSATRVNEQGLVEDVQILSGELAQNGDFEQIGAEEVTNGNFDTDSDWTLPSGSNISGGSLNIDGTQTGTINVSQTITSLDLTKIYKVTFTVSNYTAGRIKVKISNDAQGTNKEANGTYTEYLSGMSNKALSLTANVDFIGSIDNVSVKEVGQNWTFGTGWSMGDGKVVADGTMSASNNLIQSYNFTDGNKYRFSFTISDYQSGSIFIRQPFSGGADAVSANGTFTFDYIAGSANEIRFRSNDGFIGSLDNVSYKEVTDDTDLPRIDFTDGTGSLKFEPQRTNLLTYSEDFSQWASSGVTITSNSAISPDGTQNASLFSHSGGSFPQIALSGITFVSSANYFPSLYVKSDGTTQVQHSLIVNGQVVNFTPTNEWVRVSDLIVSPDTSGSFVIAQNSGSAVAASFYIWGGQLEQGDYATSYIVSNSGSATTRSADVANNSGNADLFNDSEGVLYAEIAIEGNMGDNLNITASDSSTNNYLKIIYLDNTNKIRGEIKGGGASDYVDFTNIQFEQFYKVAISYKSSEFKMFVDGTQIGNTITSFNLPTGLKELAFDRGDGGLDFYGKTKAVAVFKEALTDAELQQLTS